MLPSPNVTDPGANGQPSAPTPEPVAPAPAGPNVTPSQPAAPPPEPGQPLTPPQPAAFPPPAFAPAPQPSYADAMRAQYQARLASMQTALSQQHEAHQREIAELRARMEAMDTADMTDDERNAYERDRYREQLEAREQELQQVQFQFAYQQRMSEWANYYARLGVPPQYLNMRSFPDLVGSATQYIMWRQAQQPQGYPAQPGQPPQPGYPQTPGQPGLPRAAGFQPPQVAAATPGTAPGHRAFNDMEWQEIEKIYKQFEQGRLNPADLPVWR